MGQLPRDSFPSDSFLGTAFLGTAFLGDSFSGNSFPLADKLNLDLNHYHCQLSLSCFLVAAGGRRSFNKLLEQICCQRFIPSADLLGQPLSSGAYLSGVHGLLGCRWQKFVFRGDV